MQLCTSPCTCASVLDESAQKHGESTLVSVSLFLGCGVACVCLCGRYRSIHVLLCIQVVDGYLVRSKQRFCLFPSVKYMYF